jgi:hypothetical protein
MPITWTRRTRRMLRRTRQATSRGVVADERDEDECESGERLV